MTATTDTTPTATKSSSRRALLAGALGGLGAWAASAIGRASPAHAADGDPIYIGANNYGTSETRLGNTAPNSVGFRADSGSGSGYGVIGTTDNGWGVYGSGNNGIGVLGTSSSGIGTYGQSDSGDQPAVRGRSVNNGTGVHGHSASSYTIVPPAKPKTGVYGYANQDKDSRGVWGFSGRGVGVMGQANRGGYAFLGRGRVKFEKVSGVATIAAGNTAVSLSPNVNVTHGSFVLLTPKANIGSRGLWFTTNPSADSITIHLSSSRSSATKIAWLLLG
ncbi:MAG TPA: hypothetical protein VK845_14905 [Gemmatimonadales bacterium]|nr:hypothetical protein [Gemmatimonadales bacterium]